MSSPGVISVSSYKQSERWAELSLPLSFLTTSFAAHHCHPSFDLLFSFDIRNTQLGIYHAQLELNFDMLRTLTPA